ncbi:MAG: ribonuclease HII [Candidatus Diapherotrites archaeon]|nr:ribonuclease HII [Candidatus Diapherotrites archaeon]
MLVAGIDEAGRGPAIGPLVVASAVVEKRNEEELIALGVKDSKILSKVQRQKIFRKLKRILHDFRVVKISPKELDELMIRKSLNEIEAIKIAEMLNSLEKKPEAVVVDSPDFYADNFSKRILKYLTFKPVIIAEHKADSNHPVVSAASIIAKIHRDREIEILEKKHGRIGSGYVHDPITQQFLKKWIDNNGKLPSFARKMWYSNQKMLDEKFQKSLSGWYEE